jgi:hypothetical protein
MITVCMQSCIKLSWIFETSQILIAGDIYQTMINFGRLKQISDYHVPSAGIMRTRNLIIPLIPFSNSLPERKGECILHLQRDLDQKTNISALQVTKYDFYKS